MRRDLFDEEHRLFRETVRDFMAREVAPHHARWEKDGIVPRELWQKAGKLGLLGLAVPEGYGGAGVTDFRYNAVIVEEIMRGRRHRRRLLAAQRHRRAVPGRPHHRGAETALAARLRLR